MRRTRQFHCTKVEGKKIKVIHKKGCCLLLFRSDVNRMFLSSFSEPLKAPNFSFRSRKKGKRREKTRRREEGAKVAGTWARLRVCRDLVAVAWVVVAVTWAWGREEDEAPNFLKDSAHVPRETPHVPAGDAPRPAGSTPRAAGGLSSPAGSRLKR
jgi:hypothetical protein